MNAPAGAGEGRSGGLTALWLSCSGVASVNHVIGYAGGRWKWHAGRLAYRGTANPRLEDILPASGATRSAG